MLIQADTHTKPVKTMRLRLVAARGSSAETTGEVLAACLRRCGYQAQTTTTTSVQGKAVLVDAVAPGEGTARDVTLLLDGELTEQPEMLAALTGRGYVVAASHLPAHQLRQLTGDFLGTLVTVEAEAIADAHGADPFAPVLGAFTRLLPDLKQPLADALWEAVGRRWPYTAMGAARAFTAGCRCADVH